MLGALLLLGCLIGLTGSVGLVVQLRKDEEDETWRLGEEAAAGLFVTGLAAAVIFFGAAVAVALSPRFWNC